jgi:hypothetical protein
VNKSDTIAEIAKALHAAQGEMSGAKKGASNPFFKSKYADMNSVVDAVRTPFCNHGLSYSQFPVYQDGFAGVTTILMHNSGEWMEDTCLLPVVKKDPQAVGSAITYARRYSLQSIAGIPSEDDDGNAASQPAKAKQGGGDIAKLQAHIEKCGFTSQQVCESYKVNSLSELNDFNAVANTVTQWTKG